MRQGSLPHALPTAGEVVGDRYELRREVAGGGMGVVFEALDLKTGADVAVKVLRPEAVDVGDVAARFEREGKLAARIQHPNVVRVHELGATPAGVPYLVMELLAGRDLSKELKLRRRLPIGLACEIVARACEGVAAIHAAGIVHRDLKPSNIFLVPDGERVVPKVLDFGVSKVMDPAESGDVTMTRVAIGTPLYMSPEQVRSARRVDERTDVWAMGVILFQLLAGKTPFDGEGPTAIAASIVADDPLELRGLRAEVPEALDRVVRLALEKSAAKRLPSVLALRDALAPFCEAAAPLAPAQPGAPVGRADDPSGPNGTRMLHTPPSDASAPPLHVDSRAVDPQDAPTAFLPMRLAPPDASTGGPAPAAPPAPPAASRRPVLFAALGGVGLGAAVLLGVGLTGGASPKRAAEPERTAREQRPAAPAPSSSGPAAEAPPEPPPSAAPPPSSAPPVAATPQETVSARGPEAPAKTARPATAPKAPPPGKTCARKILVDGKLVCP